MEGRNEGGGRGKWVVGERCGEGRARGGEGAMGENQAPREAVAAAGGWVLPVRAGSGA